MGKTAKLKKKQSAPRSRDARRAASPSIDLDKSLLNLPRPESPSSAKRPTKPHVLASQSPGITKRNKSKPLKRQQRLRQIKGMERAADVMDRMELRVQKSVVKEKKVKERSKAWEDVNGIKKKDRKKANAFEALDAEGGDWVSDEEMPEVGGEVEETSQTDGIAANAVVPESVPPSVAAIGEEEEYI
jgi:hypothetical protein